MSTLENGGSPLVPVALNAKEKVMRCVFVLCRTAPKKRLIAALKRCQHCQQLSHQLPVLFGKLGHAVIGPRCLVAFGFRRLFHDEGVPVNPAEVV